MVTVGSVSLVISILLAMAMIVALCRRAYHKSNGNLSQLDQQHKKALYEMMPLLAYPILLLVIIVPAIAMVYYNTYHSGVHVYPTLLEEVYQVSISLMSFLHPFLFIIHVCVVLCVRRKKRTLVRSTSYTEGRGSNTVNAPQTYLQSFTYFTFPEEG